MDDFIGFLFFWLFIEFIFWGLAYSTGSLLINLFSLGKWYPDSLLKNKETGKILKHQSGFKLIKRSNKTYLGASAVAFIGFCFWVAVLFFIFSYSYT